ncbi:MAG: amidohydrolase [Clostridia bacterium]|nr:amidohydrolase [Clostridia bacterium]
MILEQSRKNRDTLINFATHIYDHAETGFKEKMTAEYIDEQFRKMGYETITGVEIPYVKATYDSKKPGPAIAIIGEMDSIIINDKPVHACGHNIECTNLLGSALLLKQMIEQYDITGKIHFMAVPAEEHIEMQHRLDLMKKGVIRYPSGKPELMYRGLFDDVDICIMAHCMPQENEITLSTSSNGNIIKKVTFTGKAAHAGNAPEEGVNALYAANLSLNAINALRETFTEKQYARVHPIITKGGDAVNVIPSEVIIESYIRAATLDDISQINDKVNRAFVGCAHAMGTKVEINDVPGYLPMYTSPLMNDYVLPVAKSVFNKEIETFPHLGLCSDMGDMSSVMPILHPYIGGVSGTLHGNDFRMTDPDIALVKGSAFLFSVSVSFLVNNAAVAYNIINEYKPLFNNFREYFTKFDSMYNTIISE